jgi:hypothetical protein
MFHNCIEYFLPSMYLMDVKWYFINHCPLMHNMWNPKLIHLNWFDFSQNLDLLNVKGEFKTHVHGQVGLAFSSLDVYVLALILFSLKFLYGLVTFPQTFISHWISRCILASVLIFFHTKIYLLILWIHQCLKWTPRTTGPSSTDPPMPENSIRYILR